MNKVLKQSMKQTIEERYNEYRKESLRIASEVLSLNKTGISLKLVDTNTYRAFQ
jgi:hypothetical protein